MAKFTLYYLALIFICTAPLIKSVEAAEESADVIQYWTSGEIADSFGGLMSSVLRSLMRFNVLNSGKKSPKTLPYSDDIISDGVQEETKEKAIAYGAGVALIAGVPAILALLGLFGCIGSIVVIFCGFCYCHNPLKNKRPSKRRHLLIPAIFLGIFFLIGLIIAAGMDNSLKKMIKSPNTISEKVFGVADELISVTHDTQESVTALWEVANDTNSFLFESIPDTDRLNQWSDCVESLVDILLRANGTFRNNLTEIVDLTESAFNFSKFETSLVDAQNILSEIPNLTEFAKSLIDLNSSLSNLPDFDSLELDLISLNDSLTKFNGIDTLTLVGELDSLQSLLTNLSAVNISGSLMEIDIALELMPDLQIFAWSLEVPEERTSKSLILGNLTQMNNSLNALPDLNDVTAQLQEINNTVNQIDEKLHPDAPISQSLREMELAIDSFPNTTSVISKLDKLEDFRLEVNALGLNSMKTDLQNLELILNETKSLIPQTTDILISLNNSIYNLTQGGFFSNLKLELGYFRNSIDSIDCVDIIIESIIQINKTLVYVPKFDSNLAELMELNDTYRSNLTSLNSTLVDAIRLINDLGIQLEEQTSSLEQAKEDLNSFSTKINDVPDLKKLSNDLDSLNASLEELSNISSYKTNLQEIEVSLNSFSDLKSLNDSILSARNEIAGFSLENQFTYLENLKANVTIMKSAINDLYIVTNAMPEPISDSTPFDDFRAQLLVMDDLIRNRPSSSSMLSNLNNISNSLDVTEFSNFSSQITEFENRTDTLGDISRIFDSASQLNASQQDLPNFSALNATLLNLNTSILDAREVIDSNLILLRDMEAEFQSLNLDSMLNQFDVFDSFDDSVIASINDALESVRNLDIDSQVNIMHEFFQTVIQTIEDAKDTISSTKKEAKESYQEYEDQYKAYVDPYRNFVSVAFIFLGAFPLLIFFSIILALSFKKKWCSRVFVCALCPLVPLYFILSVPFLGIATVFSDHCPIIDDAILSQFGNFYRNENQSVIEIREEEAVDFLRYYLTCEGSQFRVFDVLRLSGIQDEISQLNGIASTDELFYKYNVSELIRLAKEKASSSSDFFSDGIEIQQPLKRKLEDAESRIKAEIKSFEDRVDDLLDCEITSDMYNAVYSLPCVHIRGLFSSGALLLTMVPFLMCFGGCLSCYVHSSLRSEKQIAMAVNSKEVEPNMYLPDGSPHSIDQSYSFTDDKTLGATTIAGRISVPAEHAYLQEGKDNVESEIEVSKSEYNSTYKRSGRRNNFEDTQGDPHRKTSTFVQLVQNRPGSIVIAPPPEFSESESL